MKEVLSNKNRNLIVIVLLLISCILGIIVCITNNSNEKLIFYSIGYIVAILSTCFIEKFKIISVPVLFSGFHFAFIGGSPIFKYLRLGEYCDEQYAIILFSYILFVFAYYMCELLFTKVKKLGTNKHSKQINISTYKILILLMWIASVVANIIFIIKGNFLNGNLETTRVTAMQGNGILVYLSWLGIIANCMYFELFLKKKGKLSTFIITSAITIILSLMLGYRSRLITYVLIILMMYNKTKKIKNFYVIIIALVGIIIVALLGILRANMSNLESNSLLNEILIILDNGSTNIQYMFDYFPEKVPFQHGSTFLINILMLLPGPDMDFTLWLKEKLNLTFAGGGVTPTLLGEFYINFNYIGVLIGFALLGIVAYYLQKYYSNSEKVFFSSLLFHQFVGSVRGGLGNIETNLLVFSIAYWGVYLISKKIKIIDYGGKNEENSII